MTEFAAEVKRCPGCGVRARGEFPAAVDSAVQYGPEITAKLATSVVGHHVAVHRSTMVAGEPPAVKASTGFAASLHGRAAALQAHSTPAGTAYTDFPTSCDSSSITAPRDTIAERYGP